MSIHESVIPPKLFDYQIILRDFAYSTQELAFNKLHNVNKNLAWPPTYARVGAVKSQDLRDSCMIDVLQPRKGSFRPLNITKPKMAYTYPFMFSMQINRHVHQRMVIAAMQFTVFSMLMQV